MSDNPYHSGGFTDWRTASKCINSMLTFEVTSFDTSDASEFCVRTFVKKRPPDFANRFSNVIVVHPVAGASSQSVQRLGELTH